MFNTKYIAAVLVVALALTACGGGGGGSSSSGTSGGTTGGTTGGSSGIADPTTSSLTITSTQVCTSLKTSTLQTCVPLPTYASNSDNYSAFMAINTFRANLGLGLFKQNALLDRSVQNHVNYEVANSAYGHDEISGNVDFTGTSPANRGVYVGYGSSVGEVGTPVNGADGIAVLIDTVYHRSIMMIQYENDMGIANATSTGTLNFPVEFVDLGVPTSAQQHNASNFSAYYPFNGDTGIKTFMMAETINPFPNITTPSSPISFDSVAGSTLVVSTFTVTQQGATTPLQTVMLTQATDTNNIIPSNEAFIVATTPFAKNTQYNVQFVGTVNGTSVTANWSFTTGSI